MRLLGYLHLLNLKKLTLFILITQLNFSCKEDERLPAEPKLTFEGASLVQKQSPHDLDIIKFKFFIQDGDGDLGLSYQDLDSPFHEKNYFYRDTGKPITNTKFKKESIDHHLLVSYRDRLHPPYDTLPLFQVPYCYYLTNWEIIFNDLNTYNPEIIDTLYSKENIYFNNLWIDFYTAEADGQLKLFDIKNEFCAVYNGRLPVLSNDDTADPFEIVTYSRFESSITYNMKYYDLMFKNKKIIIKASVVDRALNVSNEIQSTPLQF